MSVPTSDAEGDADPSCWTVERELDRDNSRRLCEMREIVIALEDLARAPWRDRDAL